MNNLNKIPHFADNPLNNVPFKKTVSQMRSLTKATPAEAGNEIWFLTLSDLLMLLLIFFVLLFGITIKQQSNPIVPASLHAEKILPVAVTKEQPVAPPLAPPVASSDSAAQSATASLESDLLGIIDDNSGLQGITVARHSQYVVLTLPEQISFDSGQAQLKSSVLPKLEQIAVFIQNHPNLLVEIQGHTDDRPISNRRYPSNWELSADRATQVAKSLVHLGVNPAKISTKGFGEYQPLYSNNSDSDRLKNRRVELQFSLNPSS
jgi:chemotaxis protein MotB